MVTCMFLFRILSFYTWFISNVLHFDNISITSINVRLGLYVMDV